MFDLIFIFTKFLTFANIPASNNSVWKKRVDTGTGIVRDYVSVEWPWMGLPWLTQAKQFEK